MFLCIERVYNEIIILKVQVKQLTGKKLSALLINLSAIITLIIINKTFQSNLDLRRTIKHFKRRITVVNTCGGGELA